MQPIAKALSPEDRVAITSYYAEMPVPAAQTGPAPAPDPDRPGEKLALLGKWNDGIPACVQCHGPGGIAQTVHRRREALDAHAVTVPEPPLEFRFPELRARAGATLLSVEDVGVAGRLRGPVSGE